MRSPRYDEWHFQRWKGKDGKAPKRPSEYKVFNSIAQSYRQRLCTRLSLPKAVKDIFQRPKAREGETRGGLADGRPDRSSQIRMRMPASHVGFVSTCCGWCAACLQPPAGFCKDEDDWHKLEQFRRALLRIVEGEDWLLVDGEEASAIALAVESCANDTFVDEVGRGCRMRIPEGARLQLDGVFDTKEDVAAAVSAMGNGDNWLCFLRCTFSLPAGCARWVCRGA